jgi:NAD(P)-dependent dehydrogenase (short-subunit alcohol dehydrogenase family)
MTRDHNQHVLDSVFNQGPAVLITSALTGIGRATALAFARDGARIVVSGGHDDKGNALVAELQAIGAEAAFIKSDDRHDDEVRTLVDETVKQLGRLDVAVNNASTEGNPGPLTDQTAESYAAIFDTNVLSTLLSMKHELRVMLPQGSGSIVNVSCTCDRAVHPARLSMLPASMRWKVLPRQQLLSLPRLGCASMSSLLERSRPAC